MQKSDPYTKVFSTLPEVILMCCILAQLDILCSNMIKPYFTKMAIHPLFTVHMLRPLHAFSNILNLIEAEQSIHKTFSTLSGVRKVFLILLHLDILCTSAVKLYCDLNDNSPYTCHLFSVYCCSWKQEKLATE